MLQRWFLLFFLAGCAGTGPTSEVPPYGEEDRPPPSALPATRPPDFVAQVAYYGGMTGTSRTLTCQASGCTLTRTDEGGERQTDEKPVSSADLDEIYEVARAQSFDTIRMQPPGPPPDGSSTSYAITVAGKRYHVSPHANEDVAPRDAPRAAAFGAALDAVAGRIGLGASFKPPGPVPP